MADPNDKVYAQDLAKQAAKKRTEDAEKAKAAAEAPKVIAHHRVTGDETLSHLSLKYYGHTTEPYWRLIYEFNKEKIGPNYKNIYDGLVLDIPELPAALK
jgi:nucleoid-associated protein YgaU